MFKNFVLIHFNTFSCIMTHTNFDFTNLILTLLLIGHPFVQSLNFLWISIIIKDYIYAKFCRQKKCGNQHS